MLSLIVLFFFIVVLFSLLWHDESPERPTHESTKRSNHGNRQ